MKVLLIVYDNQSYISTFPLGIAYIASVLKKEGHKVTIYNQDIYHYPEKHLTWYLDNTHFDLVGIGMCGGYYQYNKLLKISEAINKSKNRDNFIYIIGGHIASPEPEYFLYKTKADVIVMGEGEETILHLLREDLWNIKGIAIDCPGEPIINQQRPLIQDIDSIPFPAYGLFPMEYYRLVRAPNCSKTDFVGSIITSRGCPYNCNFCYRMDKGFRLRNVESIIDEIKLLKNCYGITYIEFMDNLTMSSKQRMVELSEAFIKEELNIKWHCEGRLNLASLDLLKLMKRAGCVFINYGIESLDNEVLKKMNKNLTVEQIKKGVKNTLKVGISPGLNIIWGSIGDTPEILWKGMKFLLKYSDGSELRTIRPTTCYPGSPLYYYAIDKGLLNGIADFYENKHINSDLVSVNFTDLSDETFHRYLCMVNNVLISNYYEKQSKRIIENSKKLYLKKDTSFRGFR